MFGVDGGGVCGWFDKQDGYVGKCESKNSANVEMGSQDKWIYIADIAEIKLLHIFEGRLYQYQYHY